MMRPLLRRIYSDRRRKAPRVTIAAGYRFDDGLLICSDTLFNDGLLKTEDRKILEFTYDNIPGLSTAFALSGSVPYCKMAIDDCRAMISSLEGQEVSQEAVVGKIREALRLNHDKHLYRHPNYKSGDPSVQLLASVYSPADQRFGCYWTYETAVNEYIAFKCIGQGEFLGHHISQPLFVMLGMSLDEVFAIAVHMLREVKRSDASCGGSSYFLVHRRKGPFSGLEQLDLAYLEKFSAYWNSAVSRVFHATANYRSTKTEFEKSMALFNKEMRNLRYSQWRAVARQSKELRALLRKLRSIKTEAKSKTTKTVEASKPTRFSQLADLGKDFKP